MRILITRASIAYVAINVCAKGLAAFAQIFAVFILTKVETEAGAAVFLLLLGYAIWFQLFEFGLAQTLQNKFNTKNISAREVLKTIFIHYSILFLIALFIVFTPYLTDILLPSDKRSLEGVEVSAFSVGAAMLVIASSNVLTQRFLLVVNKGLLGNCLLICQSVMSIAGLCIYAFIGKPNLLIAVITYLGPQIIAPLPILIGFGMRLLKPQAIKNNIKSANIFYDSLGFFGAGILSAVFLGSDYYFAAHYLNPSEVISYYLVTRIYFISFVIYYSYLLHRVRRLSEVGSKKKHNETNLIVKDAILVGSISVLLVYALSAILEFNHLFKIITNGVGAGQILLFCGFLYFLARAWRDVGVVVSSSLNNKKFIYKIYSVEIISALLSMYILVPTSGGIGIFISMMTACLLAPSFLFFKKLRLVI